MVKTLHRAHIVNFNYLLSIYPFDTFCLDASNTLLVKKGMRDYVCAGGNGIDFKVPEPDFGGCWIENIQKDPLWQLLGDDPRWSHHEGTFFDRAVFAQLCRNVAQYELILQRHLIGDAELQDFGRVEWLFVHAYRTLFGEHNTKAPYIYMRYKPEYLCWDEYEIREVLDNVDLPPGKFGIKRINRSINDWARKLIGDHFGYRHELAATMKQLEIEQSMDH